MILLRSFLLVSLILMLTFFAGCGADNEPAPGADLQISLIPAPGGLAGDYLQVQLADAAGVPITDAQVALEGNMTHAGMVPVIVSAVTDAADGSGDGIYQLPFQFTMLGDWIITVAVTLADGTTVTRDIDVTVGDDAIEVSAAAGVLMDYNLRDNQHTPTTLAL